MSNLGGQNLPPSLSCAVDVGNVEKTRELYARYLFGFDIDCSFNFEGKNLLHIACCRGRMHMVRALISMHANVNQVGYEYDAETKHTPLSLAILWHHYGVALALLREFGCDPNDGLSLHLACRRGDLNTVKDLIDHGARWKDVDANGKYTPLVLAMLNHPASIVSKLVNGFGCDPNDGMALHTACEQGNLSMVETLVNIGACVNDKDIDGKTPLHYAIRNRRFKTTLALVGHFKCDPGIEDEQGTTPLHAACRYGNSSDIKLLVEHGANLNGTHLITAVRYNQREIVKSLVLDHGCDVGVQEKGGSSLLHIAATNHSKEVLKLLINEFGLSPLLVDEEGNTPLHVCSQSHWWFDKNDRARKSDNSDCVRTLLYDLQAPVFARNKVGKTPRDFASGITKRIFKEYISEHQGKLEEEYLSMQKLAAARYSGSHCVTKLFVVGHPGAGKSSLVEALKREGFVESFNRVSSKSVALHTAGIVPSIHTSDSYGRVQFYDFAGDPEYYSSHAAILEKLFLSDIGNNICIIVLNLQEEEVELEKKYLYWLTFINHNTKNLQHSPSVIVTGSHVDLLSKEEVQKKETFIVSLFSKHRTDRNIYLSLDCCGPRSRNIKQLRQHIQELSKDYEPYSLSYEVSVLMGLLEKDFSNVTACTASTVVTHIAEVNLLRLPTSLSGLYPHLQQLQAIGSLLILGGKEEDCNLVLNVTQLTNEVHKRLFSKEAFSSMPNMASFNIGLLPQSLLREVLPPYITKECLAQLHYCQEISHVEIGQDYSLSPCSEGTEVSSSPDKSLLFFPALCTLDRSNVSWLPEGSYSIGWLARCTDPHDYFPPRFLHVLLLRVSLRFTLVAQSQDTSPDHVHLKRRCKMWKTGVHWLMEEGVECEVDVDISKEVVVSICSKKHSKKALAVFNSIISCVMEAKAEFCHSIPLKCFLLDKVGCLSEDNLFQVEEAERVLQEHNNEIVSVSGDTWMSSSKLIHIRCTFWDSLFSLDEKTVLKYTKEIVTKWFQLGLYLDLPKRVLDAIEYNNPRDVERCKLEMVSTWLGSSLPNPPCWWSLVKALQQVKDRASAVRIMREQDEPIGIQRKLLESECSSVKPEEVFLRSFSGVVGSKWPYLAALLSLGGSEIKEVRKEGEGLSQSDHAYLMLSKWASRDGSTYGQLYEKLKPASVFQLCS